MDYKSKELREEALALKLHHRGPCVYFRGLIEISNKCCKNCLYCGIRSGNRGVERYEMSDEEVMREALFAHEAGYGSVAIQGGERCDSQFVERITRLVHNIHKQYGLGITLSLGEQPLQVYKEWFAAGASRYLLRIEASNPDLYRLIHPDDGQGRHSYDSRVSALHDLKSAGYLLGSGVMIGLPFQTYAHLEEDLQFLKKIGVDMAGMGPYIPHKDTPLGKIVEFWKSGNSSLEILPADLQALAMLPRGDFWNFSDDRLLDLSIDMVARLRILMPHINIAATTALQVLNPDGREMALLSGANVIMPNMTETEFRGNYSLYEGKQGVADDAAATRDSLLLNLDKLGIPVGWREKGDWRQV